MTLLLFLGQFFQSAQLLGACKEYHPHSRSHSNTFYISSWSLLWNPCSVQCLVASTLQGEYKGSNTFFPRFRARMCQHHHSEVQTLVPWAHLLKVSQGLLDMEWYTHWHQCRSQIARLQGKGVWLDYQSTHEASVVSSYNPDYRGNQTVGYPLQSQHSGLLCVSSHQHTSQHPHRDHMRANLLIDRIHFCPSQIIWRCQDQRCHPVGRPAYTWSHYGSIWS